MRQNPMPTRSFVQRSHRIPCLRREPGAHRHVRSFPLPGGRHSARSPDMAGAIPDHCDGVLARVAAVRAAVGSRDLPACRSWRRASGLGRLAVLEAFAGLSTPLVADACVRCGVPLRAAPAGIRAVVAGQRVAGRVNCGAGFPACRPCPRGATLGGWMSLTLKPTRCASCPCGWMRPARPASRCPQP